jgi:hypothetical protein
MRKPWKNRWKMDVNREILEGSSETGHHQNEIHDLAVTDTSMDEGGLLSKTSPDPERAGIEGRCWGLKERIGICYLGIIGS